MPLTLSLTLQSLEAALLYEAFVISLAVLAQAANFFLQVGIIWFVRELPESRRTLIARLISSASWGKLVLSFVSNNIIILGNTVGKLPRMLCVLSWLDVEIAVAVNYNLIMVIR